MSKTWNGCFVTTRFFKKKINFASEAWRSKSEVDYFKPNTTPRREIEPLDRLSQRRVSNYEYSTSSCVFCFILTERLQQQKLHTAHLKATQSGQDKRLKHQNNLCFL